MARRGISRRDLFGLGLSRVGRHVEANAPAILRGTPSPCLDELRRRWAAARTPEGDALWAPVADELVSRAGDLSRAYVLVDRMAPPSPTAGVGRVPPDAAQLPFADGTFDLALSAFGLQSVPAGDDLLRELVRSVRPGAPVALATWAPGVVSELLEVAAEVDPLPEGVPPAWTWGEEGMLREALAEIATDVRVTSAELRLTAGSVSELVGRLITAIPALGAAIDEGAAPARTGFTAIADGHAEPAEEGVAVAVPYLLASARA